MSPTISHNVASFALDAQVEYDPSKKLLIDAYKPDRGLDSRQLRLLIRTLIAGFQAQGIKPGECVLVIAGNNVLYTAIFLAIMGAGGVYMGHSPHSTADELDHVVALSQPRFIVADDAAVTTVREVCSHGGIHTNRIIVLSDAAIAEAIALSNAAAPATTAPSTTTTSTQEFRTLLSYGLADPFFIPDLETAKRTPAALYATSGTTGLPKAAVLSHASLIAQHLSVASSLPYQVARLICLPFYHLFGSFWSHLFTLRYGYSLYILQDFRVPLFLDVVKRHHISDTFLVPAMVHTLNQAPASLDAVTSLRSLRYVGVSGAPIHRATMTAFQDLLHPDACIGQIWGMTETGPVFQNAYPKHGGRASQGDLGGVGHVLGDWEVKLIPAPSSPGSGEPHYRQAEAAEDEPVLGQLYIRGPGMFMGYLGHSNLGVDSQGWFNSGDVFYANKMDEYFIVGRTKELIKVRGYSVSPAEIEAVLLKHPLIVDAAVTGITLPDGSTEAPCAYVVRDKGAKGDLSVHDVYEFSQQRLASYKALDGGIFFVESIPRNVSGKIQRMKLAMMNEKREALAGLLRTKVAI